MTLVYSIMFTAIGGLIAYATHAGVPTVGMVLFFGVLLSIGELAAARVVGRHEERVYRTYDGP